MYRPLPKYLTLMRSGIEGLGLFTLIDIDPGHEFGITHVEDAEFENGYIRTPLGGFFNHSDKPNCEAYRDGRLVKLRAIKNIKSGEELTSKYWLYEICPRSSVG